MRSLVPLILILLESSHRLRADDVGYDSSTGSITKESTGKSIRSWDCPQDENLLKHQLLETSRMLEEGNRFVDGQDAFPPPASDTILVLGRAGCGKTSFVQLLAGDNGKLLSKEVGNDTNEYIIEDGVKIGSSATDSFTLYPEIVKFNSTLSFLDTPGFSDTRSPTHEIVETSVMKRVIERFPRIKIVLLVEYKSLQYGMDKGGFGETLKQLNNMVTDTDKYRNNIVLVATKVPFTYRKKGGTFSLIQDKNIIASIGQHLYQVKMSFDVKSSQTVNENKKVLYEKAIKILDSLLETDSEGNAKKINVFHRPYELGTLENMTMIQENRRSLLSTVSESVGWATVGTADFDYTLSDSAKNYLDCLLRYVNENVVQVCNTIYMSVTEHYRNLTKSKDTRSLVDDLRRIDKQLGTLQNGLASTGNYMSSLRTLTGFAESQNVSVEILKNNTLVDLNDNIDILAKFIDTKTILTPSSWLAPMNHVLQYVRDTLQWCEFLNGLFETLSSYRVQAIKEDLFNETTSLQANDSVQFVFKNSHLLFDETDFERFQGWSLNEDRLKELSNVITTTLGSVSNITCDADGKLVVAGYFVRVSEVNTEDKVSAYCGDTPVQDVALLAVQRVFIDADMDGRVFRGKNILIVAPELEVIGRRDMITTGLDGEPILADGHVKGNSSDIPGEGKPGLPGQSGGNFFGMGLTFINGASLTVRSNGGNGGPGVDGIQGAPGVPGEDGYATFSSFPPTDSNYNYTLTNGTEGEAFPDEFYLLNDKVKYFHNNDGNELKITVYDRPGKCGGNGWRGSRGGAGGLGGNPGRQKIIELLEPSQINFERTAGKLGRPGNPGMEGIRGEDGIGIRCYKIYYYNIHGRDHKYYDYGTTFPTKHNYYWTCLNTTVANSGCDRGERHVQEENTSDGILHPSNPKKFDFSTYLRDYTVLLDNHSSNSIFNKTISNFKKTVQEKFSYDMNNLWKLNF